jgi:uncharacterized damage-inducible protein DinB
MTHIHQLQNITDEFIETLSSFPDTEFNQVPYEGSWTPAQLARHVLKSDRSILRAFEGPGAPAGRDPLALKPKMESRFLDFSKKLDAPDFIKPEGSTYSKDELLEELRTVRQKFRKAAETIDLEQLCLQVENYLGPLTRMEVVYFVIFHTMRHLHQLRNMRHALGRMKSA